MEDLGGVPPRGLPQRHCGRGVFDGAGEGHCCGGVEADLCRLALEVNFPHVPMQNGDVCFDLMGRQPALDVWMETFLFKSRIYMDLPRIDGKIRKNGDINYKLVTKIVGWWPGTFIASSRLEDDHE